MANPDATVLVVDDDPDVLMVASTALANQGYKVLEANSGADALRLLHEQPGVSLLFTDIVMPGEIDGFELAHQAKQFLPSLRVVYTSGFLKDIPWGGKGIGYGPLLQKPWRQAQLIAAVEAQLRGGAGSAGQN